MVVLSSSIAGKGRVMTLIFSFTWMYISLLRGARIWVILAAYGFKVAAN
jgi:hypothetical protein